MYTTCTVYNVCNVYVHVVDNLLNISYHYRSCLHLASEIVNTMFNKRTSCLLFGMYIYMYMYIYTCVTMSANVGVYVKFENEISIKYM